MYSNSLQNIKKEHLPALLMRLSKDDRYELDGEDVKLRGDFYRKQTRIALKNYDIIDPESIEDYIALGGYFSLASLLEKGSREFVIEELKASGLRGRGGAGFPTGKKWESAFNAEGEQKYVICNADEGDPGAYMDRSILEGDPHSVLEGMAICAYAVGANKGFIYVRAEYPKAVASLITAIHKAKEKGLLGEDILGSGFSFDVELRLGAGAFVCGEGTALMESIEGKRGMPRNKEFRSTERGLWQKPTVLNNVETFANVPRIFARGAKWYASIGTEKSTGTKVFALVGKINNPGLVEVPMGTTINEIVFDIGGGIRDNKEAKAVQTGGPSGGCIPRELFDTKVDFESLKAIGSIMGSGGMVVMDETDCMVDIAKFFLEFSVDESCGKCTPCRIGNRRLFEILSKLTSGEGTMDDVYQLKDLSEIIKATSLCGLGQSSPNPILSTLNYFLDEYEEHAQGRCRAKSCKKLLQYVITDRCIGCTKCAKSCPASCISGSIKEMHIIDEEKCIRCGACFNGCPVHAIDRY